MKRILWQAPEGSVLVTVPCEPMRPGETESAYLDRIAQHAVGADPSLAACTRLPDVDTSALPQDRRWRNQWRVIGGQVQPDVALCRAERLREIRAERDARLAKADATKVKLDDIGTPAQIAAHHQYRQALRDLPIAVQTDLAAAATPDAVAACNPIWPVEG